MAIILENLLKEFSPNSGASRQLLEAQEKVVGKVLPDDYRNFLIRFNGGEGFIGKHYLILWRVEELVQFNKGYQVDDYAPGLLMFGSNGGGDGFAFDTRLSPYGVVEVPFIGMSLGDAFSVAENFSHLLQRMFETEGSLF